MLIHLFFPLRPNVFASYKHFNLASVNQRTRSGFAFEQRCWCIQRRQPTDWRTKPRQVIFKCFLSMQNFPSRSCIQTPSTPVVHPKMILAAAGFCVRCEMSRFPPAGKRFAYFASFAVPSERTRGLAHSKTLRVVRMSPANACVLDCGGPPPLWNWC